MPNRLLPATFLITALLPAVASAETFVVDTTSDADLSACTPQPADCSLRGAITAANGISDIDLITFAIPEADPGFQPTTGHWRILVGATALPGFTNGLTIDGFTQPGASANTRTPDDGGLDTVLKIEVQPATIPGNQQVGFDVGLFNFVLPASTLRGLAISGFRTQVQFAGSGAHALEGCFIGTDVTGTQATVASPTANLMGVRVQGPGPYRIGGLNPAQRNLFGGLGNAVSWFTASDGMVIQGNQFGTNAAGDARIPIHVDAMSSASPLTNALIGGDTPDARNLISGASFSAMRLFGSSATDLIGTRIHGNWIGTDAQGTRPIGNGLNPQTPSAPQPTIMVSGTTCMLSIGGLGPGEANRIAFGGASGIVVDQCRGVSSPLNEYIGNGRIAIDNANGGANVGATANDPGDADEGGNRLQNFPEITLPPSFVPEGGDSVMLQYRVDTALANATYPLTVNFYRGACGGGSRELLASDTYNNGDAQQLRNFTLTAADGGNVLPLVATAVDSAGNTSEFSPMVGDGLFVDGFEDEAAGFSIGPCR